MIGEPEVSSYNAMSACKCTLEYQVGVQSDACSFGYGYELLLLLHCLDLS
jgi:hypothetical protein